MSIGTRIPHPTALALANSLIALWGGRANPHGLVAVGSVRRRRASSGDLDLLCPLPAKGQPDRLYQELVGEARPTLFSAAEPDITVKEISGLKKGFRTATFSVYCRSLNIRAFGVQLHRAEADNLGWAAILRTGPEDFGRWFLWRWKDVMRIAPSGRASDTYLLDMYGKPVKGFSETELIKRVAPEYIEPNKRDEFMEKKNAERRDGGTW
jgi:DNA polymerase/3'-5' exonuclease PolX